MPFGGAYMSRSPGVYSGGSIMASTTDPDKTLPVVRNVSSVSSAGNPNCLMHASTRSCACLLYSWRLSVLVEPRELAWTRESLDSTRCFSLNGRVAHRSVKRAEML